MTKTQKMIWTAVYGAGYGEAILGAYGAREKDDRLASLAALATEAAESLEDIEYVVDRDYGPGSTVSRFLSELNESE